MRKKSLTPSLIHILAIAATMVVTSLYQKNVAIAQQSSMPPAEAAQHLRRIVRKNGWHVPGRDEFSAVSRVDTINFDGVEVTQKTLRASSAPLVDVEGYSIGSDGQLIISNTLCEVRNVLSYEVNEHIFAYETRLLLVSVDMRGNRERTGAMFNLWYYDEDGDGRFETRYGASELQKIPDWVKKRVQ